MWRLLRAGEPAGRFDVEIGLLGKPRTTGYRSQNHHFNGHCQQIALETGNSLSDIRWLVKVRAANEMGYPLEEMVMKSGVVTVPKSEAQATTVECSILIDMVHMVAAEEDIVLKEEDE